MDRPIILCGLGRVGRRVLDYLVAAGLPVVIIDTAHKADEAPPPGARLVVGDCRRAEVLEAAGVAGAAGVLILTKDDLVNVSAALLVRDLNPDVRVVLRLFNQNLLGRLGQAVTNVFALSTSLLTAPILAATALTGAALGTYRLDDSPSGLRQLVELAVGPASPWVGKPVADLAEGRDVAVVAHLPAEGPGRFLLGVDNGAALRAGDHVVLHGGPRDLAPLLAGDDHPNGEARWAHGLRRLWRVAARAVGGVDPAVLISALVLLVVVAVSTVVLAANLRDASVTRALVRTVSIMATAAPLGDDDLADSPNIRVFISALRIVGALLLAAFTAFVTQYLLRAKFQTALEGRRIPEAGHFVVCGLSAVGFRVVEELRRLGEPVVVLNDNPTGRFVTAARRLGAAVVIGDACVATLLREANAGTARAVVPTTSNDMTNLEVALLVRELDPHARVVPLLNDPQFARMLRSAAGVRLAVSEPALAAPAFLAGLYGDRVLAVFFAGERLCAVIDLIVGAGDAFAGAAVRDVAADCRLVPVGVVRPGGEAAAAWLEGRLQAGDRLVGILELADLERLVKRQAAHGGEG